MDIKEEWLLWLTNFLIKNSKGGGINIGLESNEQLAKELHKLLIRNF